MGDRKARVRTVAVGFGYAIPTFKALNAGADVLVVVFDRAYQTITRFPLLDFGANLIVVEHGVSEMPGMMNMAEFINRTVPGLKAKFYRHDYASTVVTP